MIQIGKNRLIKFAWRPVWSFIIYSNLLTRQAHRASRFSQRIVNSKFNYINRISPNRLSSALHPGGTPVKHPLEQPYQCEILHVQGYSKQVQQIFSGRQLTSVSDSSAFRCHPSVAFFPCLCCFACMLGSLASLLECSPKCLPEFSSECYPECLSECFASFVECSFCCF